MKALLMRAFALSNDNEFPRVDKEMATIARTSPSGAISGPASLVAIALEVLRECADGLDWRRSDLVGDCGHGLYAAVDHEADVEMVLVAGHGELERVPEVERRAEVEASE
jgi:hypothetical protein